ncbi:MAG TPA: anaerobic ribonucleoside-triphosphate reductase activating protein [Bacteroidales bacterium]|jgi:pyruvate formate lyase activating enzyme|nr:anaerobic ribonucleoside-triphosphate reductase activating protein [Bacteroidales bacterium]
MRIASLQKQSFIDWEGKTAAVIFTKGCNFRCGYCHNPSLVLPHLLDRTPDLSEKEIMGYLLSRKNWLDGVVITGGEPTIQPDLPTFMAAVKEAGFAIKLDTNGTNPDMLNELIKNKLTDYIAMDIKTVLEEDKYSEIIGVQAGNLINRVAASVELLRKGAVNYQLRTTLIPTMHTPEIKNRLVKEFKSDNYVLQEFRSGVTIETELSHKSFEI